MLLATEPPFQHAEPLFSTSVQTSTFSFSISISRQGTKSASGTPVNQYCTLFPAGSHPAGTGYWVASSLGYPQQGFKKTLLIKDTGTWLISFVFSCANMNTSLIKNIHLKMYFTLLSSLTSSLGFPLDTNKPIGERVKHPTSVGPVN